MKKILIKNSGITLIALVVTIIVLLILAGITISLLLGENGLITKALEAKKQYEDAAKNEILDLEDLAHSMDDVKIEDLGIGWTLGNSLDSYDKNNTPLPNVSDYETLWHNPVTTKEMITAVANAGYKTLLIPVTWYPHLDENNNIDPAWLNRVEEIVDYALDNNMYVILNVHHDDKTLGLDLPEAEFQNTIQKYKKVWSQIATHFSNKSSKLIFELINEPRVIVNGEDVWHPDSELPFQNLNNFTKELLASIRQTGANNSNRWVLIPYYGASIIRTMLEKVEVPQDNYVALSAHAYLSWDYTSTPSTTVPYTEEIREKIRYSLGLLKEFKETKHIPVVITETGCKQKPDRNTWIRDLYYLAGKYDIPIMYWDNGKIENEYGIFDRTALNFPDTTLVNFSKTYYHYTKTARNAIEGINTTSEVNISGPEGMGINKVNGKNHYFMNTTPAGKYRFKFSETYALSNSGIYEFSCKIKTAMPALDIKMVLDFYDENDNIVKHIDYLPISTMVDGSKELYEFTKIYYVEGATKVKLERLYISEIDIPVNFELYDITLTDLSL